jgi:D-beta-D-heptose 7-phosphate kinase/D-beta-D-heptose 1-phosphate adenosyltransferase
MLDEYIHGTSERLSPEAPVPIVAIQSKEYRLGGAANVAANIASLGGQVILAGLVGYDNPGTTLRNKLAEFEIKPVNVCVDAGVKTTLKTRIVANKQQVVRLDDEDMAAVSTLAWVTRNIKCAIEAGGYGAIVISDYAKGVINQELVHAAYTYSSIFSAPLFVDTKMSNRHLYSKISVFHNTSHAIFTPNKHEAESITGLKITGGDDITQVGQSILQSYAFSHVLITRGADGMSLVTPGGRIDIPTAAKKVFDVSGAGDTVIAVMALERTTGLSLRDCAILANRAAGIVVGKPGTATVTREELEGA